jgi:hypothetical protein
MYYKNKYIYIGRYWFVYIMIIYRSISILLVISYIKSNSNCYIEVLIKACVLKNL